MTRQRHIHPLKLSGIVCLGLLCSSSVFAQQDEGDRQRGDRDQQQQQRERAQQELPQFLQELDLSSEQETQIKQTMRQHNRKLRQTWREFHTTHAQAIELQAAWAAAVRDTLSEEDQRKFDQQRMQDREMNRRAPQDASQQRGSATDRQRDAREGRQQEQAASPEQRDERQVQRQQRQAERQRRQQQRNQQQAQADSESASDRSQFAGQPQEYLVVITTASPERYTQGTNQSSQQKQQCAEACQKYKEKLTSLWQDLHQLHHELVQIEADRIQAVEEQLTEDQLTKLQESRQEPQAERASGTSQQRSR